MNDREAIKFLFDHHARLCKRSDGTYYVDFGESFSEVARPNMKNLKKVAEAASKIETTEATGDVLDELVKKQEPWDALSRIAGCKIV
jgi:hypothetical protein